jgi:hypothetical protein
MKESLRAIFAGDLEIDEVNEMLDHWCKRASRSRLPSSSGSQRPSELIEKEYLPPSDLGYPMEGSRDSTPKFAQSLPARKGFHSAKAALALVMLACGPIDLKLPYERASLST